MIVSYNSIVGCFHCGIAVLLLVVFCVYVLSTVNSCGLLGGYLPWVFEFLATPPKQVLKVKQWSNQSVVKLSLNWLLQVKSLRNLRLLTLCNVTNFNIFFLWRKLKCKSSKSYAYGLPSPPAAKGTSLMGQGGGGGGG